MISKYYPSSGNISSNLLGNSKKPALLWSFSHYKNTKNKGGLLPLHLVTTKNS
jgi:hypothetical protein